MEKLSTNVTSTLAPSQPLGSTINQVIGIDLGDTHSYLCALNEVSGEIDEEVRIKTTPEAFTRYFSKLGRVRITLETGTHSPWVSRLLEELGHDVLVANARHLRLIYQNDRKNDRLDAENLARLARLDPKLLHPITHRSENAQADLAVIKARDALVASRTQLINHARGTVKAFGLRLPKCDAQSFHLKVAEAMPDALRPALGAILETIGSLTERIKQYDAQIAELNDTYEETALLRQVPGVGPITALTFVLTLEDKFRFKKSRTVGAFLGLSPSRDQSGERDPRKGISKRGNSLLRRLLVQCANRILQKQGADSDLRRFAQRLLARDGRGARGKAIVALARKLAVLLHRLWLTGETYDPLYNSKRAEVAVAN